MSTTHSFNKSLKTSEEVAREPWWEEIYRRAFPAFERMRSATRDEQRCHIDRVITIKSGHTFNIEEKFRPLDYPDFALEFLSVKEEGRPGWICDDGHTDFLAYVFMQYRRCWLFPWATLRLAWLEHGERWISDYRQIPAKNDSYTTMCVAVPIPVVVSAITNEFGIPWGERDLRPKLGELPKASTKFQQVVLPGHFVPRHGGKS